MTAPCKDCPKRELGCHNKCARYQAFKRTREQARERAMAEKEADYSEIERFKRIRKRRHL